MRRRQSRMLKTLVFLEKHDGAIAGDLEDTVLDGKFLSAGDRRSVGGCGVFTHGYGPLFERRDERLMMRKDGNLSPHGRDSGRERGAVETRLADACDDEVKSNGTHENKEL